MINLYDSTMSETLRNYIPHAIEFLNTVYNDDFYLYFNMDGDSQLLDDDLGVGVDACSHGSSQMCDSACRDEEVSGTRCDELQREAQS